MKLDMREIGWESIQVIVLSGSGGYEERKQLLALHTSFDDAEAAMSQQEGRLVYGPGERYILHRLPLREGNPLDILVGNTWVSGHVHDEASDGNESCDAYLLSIPLYDGREARFRLEPVPHELGDEEDLMLAGLAELGEVYGEDDWDEEFKDEER